MKCKLIHLFLMLGKYAIYGVVIQCVAFTFLLASESNAQKTMSVRDTYVELGFENANLQEAIAALESKTDYTFVYQQKVVKNAKDVNLVLNNGSHSVADVLLVISEKSGLRFKQVNNNININKLAVNENPVEVILEDVTISGIIRDSDGEALPGVNVVLKGTTNGTISGIDGAFKLTVPQSSILVFTSIGFETQEIEVGNRSTFDITMTEDVQQLSEVVVVGYGTQKKINNTGAISAISGEEINARPVTDTRQALQGIAPGVTLIDRGGLPGNEDINIKIRGVGTLSNANPLVLVDGIEMKLNDVSPDDIESISVLKDAASASIYGSRAANGVILVTTKRGNNGPMKISYNGYVGFQQAATLPEQIGAQDYLTLVNEALVNAGLPEKFDQDYINRTVAGNDPENYPYVNVYEEMLGGTAPISNHQLRLSGGNDFATLAMSVNRMNQEGLLPNVDTDRTGVRVNSNIKLAPKLNLKLDTWYNQRNSQNPYGLWTGIRAMAGTAPTTVLRYKNGAYGLNKDNNNALAQMNESGLKKYKTETIYLRGAMDYEIINGLKATVDFSYKGINQFNTEHQASYDFQDPNDLTQIAHSWENSSIKNISDRVAETNLQAFLDYTKTFGDHDIHLLGGFSQIENVRDRFEASRQDLYSNDLPQLNLGDIESASNLGFQEDWALRSYFGRVNYMFKNRYLLEGNIRYDGSSRFAEGNKWGVFPSVSAGWIVSEESFLQGVNAITNLKLRASWGQLGNQNIGLYKFTSSVQSGYNYTFNDNLVNGYSQVSYANTDISWETTEILDFGLDFSVLNGKVAVEADWFRKDTKDILLTLPISYLVGLQASEINAGQVRNTGWEAKVTYRDQIGGLKYSVGVNFSDVKNELVDFGGKEALVHDSWYIYEEGESIGALYGYKTDGLFQTQGEIDNHALQPNHAQLKPGDIKMVDVNNDDIIDDEDRVVMGNTIPRYSYGINLNAEFKGFDLAVFFQGVGKVDNYFYGAPNEGPNFEIFSTERVLDRWTPDNPDASYPRLEAANNKNNAHYNDFWVRDASYFRLKNLQIGYTIPATLTDRVKVERLRIYVGGTNLFTITDVESGLDPETYDGRPNYYPPLKIYSMGINLTF